MEMNDLNSVLEEQDTPPIKEQEDIVLKPLLAEINLISNPEIKSFTRAVLLRAGPFWTMPVFTELGLYPPDEYDLEGNVLHTKRVVRAIMLLSYGYTVTSFERDMAISAALLHGTSKGVYDGDGNVAYDPMYPYTVRRLVESEDILHAVEGQSNTLDLDQAVVAQILKLVRGQMGAHSVVPETIPKPYTYENILHIALLIAMNIHHIVDGEEIIEERWDHGEFGTGLQETGLVD